MKCPFKQWTKGAITDADWSFGPLVTAITKKRSQVPEEKNWMLVYRAFTWELDRELGSGNGPFNPAMVSGVSVDSSHDSIVATVSPAGTVEHQLASFPPRDREHKKVHVLQQWHGTALAELARHIKDDTAYISRDNNRIVALEIPWYATTEELMDAFGRFLRHRPMKKKPGRPKDWRLGFLQLANYRLHCCGYKPDEVRKFTNVVAAAIKNSSATELTDFKYKTDRSNFGRDLRATRDRVRKRFEYLQLQVADWKKRSDEAVSSGFPAYPRRTWKDFFLRA